MEFILVLYFMLHIATETFKSRFYKILEHTRRNPLFKLGTSYIKI
jgi:hypothetical protein